MSCAKYGVAVTRIRHGRMIENGLVINPENGAKHLVSVKSLQGAVDLCGSMRRANADSKDMSSTVAYTVVPLPVTGVSVITEMWE